MSVIKYCSSIRMPAILIENKNEVDNESKKIFETLKGREKAIHLSMKSQYFYQNGQYNEAEECAKQCVNETRALLESEFGNDDAWL